MYNIKAQLLSLQRAHATGCWVGMGQEPTRCPMAQVLMTPMALSKQAMLSSTWYAQHWAMSRRHAQEGRLLHITTERFLGMNKSLWRSTLGAFLLFCKPCWEQG
jgi:hypothetical protein